MGGIGLENYSSLNTKYRKKLVFHLGIEAGFFSEYNNMILAMAWCLQNQVQFTLYSQNAWFSNLGWTEFFVPFCREETASIHNRLNTREVPPPRSKTNILLKWLTKVRYGISYFTYERWNHFRDKGFEDAIFDIKELSIKGNLLQTCRALTDITWRYNLETQEEVNSLVNAIDLPSVYLGFHIRGGDKYIEDDLQPVHRYLNETVHLSNCKNAFILTDDYRIIEEVRREFTDWNIYSLCQEDEQGYYHQEFMKKDREYIKKKSLRLFASTDILSRSEYFIGTFTSNPGMFMGMRMDTSRCLGLGGTSWKIW